MAGFGGCGGFGGGGGGLLVLFGGGFGLGPFDFLGEIEAGGGNPFCGGVSGGAELRAGDEADRPDVC